MYVKAINILEKHFSGHKTIGPATFYGYNAMNFAINIYTRRWGYICFQPPVWMRGRWWPWKFYLSPDATPGSSTFAIGPGINHIDKIMSGIRRYLFGHGFAYGDDFTEWNRNLRDNLEEIHSLNRTRQAGDTQRTVKCEKCGQVDTGQTGEYPCPVCGLPMVWDEAP